MPTTYVGTPVFNQSIIIPVDGDLADAASVNVSATAEIDTQLKLFEVYGQMMQSTCPIRAQWSAVGVGFSVDIAPIPFIVVTEGGTWKTIFTTTTTNVGVAALEGGGAYLPNTWYYVYAYSVAGVCNFQISTIPPDQFSLYKNGTFSMKFICSVRTDPFVGSLQPFQKYGNYVSYEIQQPIGGGSSTALSPLLSADYIPPTSSAIPRMCKIIMDSNSAATINDTVVTVKSSAAFAGYTFFVRASGVDTTIFDAITDLNRTIYYQIANIPTLPTVNFYLVGYYE